jgi:hypothetical protein
VCNGRALISPGAPLPRYAVVSRRATSRVYVDFLSSRIPWKYSIVASFICYVSRDLHAVTHRRAQEFGNRPLKRATFDFLDW